MPIVSGAFLYKEAHYRFVTGELSAIRLSRLKHPHVETYLTGEEKHGGIAVLSGPLSPCRQ